MPHEPFDYVVVGAGMETPEEHAHVGTIDVMCGFSAALGVATALYQRRRTGVAGRARTSLSALSGLAQMPFCYDYEGRGPFDEPSGREANGFNELIRFYHASDQFVLLHAYEDDIDRFEQIPEMQGFSELERSERAEFLAHVFPMHRAADWVERLQRVGIGAAVCETLETIRAEASRPADGGTGIDRGSYSFSVYEEHPCGHRVIQLDPYAIRPVRSRIHALRPSEKYGTSTRAVLHELGYEDTEIDDLIEARVVSESYGREYLPS